MQKVKSFEFSSSFGAGGESKYKEIDFDTLLDGGTYHLVAGTDFTTPVGALIAKIRVEGIKRKKTFRSNKVPNASSPGLAAGLVIQAEDATDEQIAKWEEQKEAAKVALKKRAAEAATNGTPATTTPLVAAKAPTPTPVQKNNPSRKLK